MSPLRQAVEDYLTVRRRLGFQLKHHGVALASFVGFLEAAGATRVTTELALSWARLPAGTHPHYWRQRLGIARGFARYLATIDPDSEVPPPGLLPVHRSRVAPYLYSNGEIAALMAAARALSPRLRGASYEALIGLLAVSGMRPGEALALDRDDLDLDQGLLTVRAGKRLTQRELPLHQTTSDALRAYARLRDRLAPRTQTPAFFLSAHAQRISQTAFNTTFPKLTAQVGLEGRGQRGRPRPMDIRHSFAVRALLDWHHGDEQVERKLPLLANYLGHIDPSSTYWYLQASPELLALVGQRLDGLLGARQ